MYDTEDIKNKTYWLAICDLDEFFFGTDRKLTIKLKSLNAYNIIYCNWFMFGSNNCIEHPTDIRTANVHREVNLSRLGKYIFKPSAITHSDQITIHGIYYYWDDSRVCNENNLVRLYHYPIQSLEFFQKVKMTRGAADGEMNEYVRNMTYFEDYNKEATLFDDILKNLVETPPDNYNEE